MLKRAIRRYGITVLLLFGTVISPVRAEEGAPAEPAKSGSKAQETKAEVSLDLGKAVYTKRCLGCHGEKGEGDGPAAERFTPRPRDFTKGLFKYKTTPHGSLPTDDDLFNVVSNGLPGTGMPAWSSLLKEHEIRSAIQYVKALSGKFTGETAKPISFGPEVPPTKESVEKGKDLFNKVGCIMCHGPEGRGNGPLAPTLKDAWGRHVQPRNLTLGYTFRGGNAPKDVYTRINTGLMGTPMPSFEKTLDNEKSWAIANYVNSLSQYPGRKPDWDVAVIAKPVEGDLPDDPDDPRWEGLQRFSFPLVGQVTIDPRMFTPTVTMVTAKGMYNKNEFSLLLIWDDPTQSVATPAAGDAAPQIYDDAIAIQFPTRILEGTKKPYFIMGDVNNSVYVARWTAGPNKIDEFNANGTEVRVGLRIKPQDEAHWQFKGKGRYKNGQYRAVFKRPLVTDDKETDLQIEPGKFYPIAFTAWDGSNGEHDAMRSLSAWYSLLLEVPPSKDRFVYPTLFLIVVVGIEWWITRSYRKGNGNGNGKQK